MEEEKEKEAQPSQETLLLAFVEDVQHSKYASVDTSIPTYPRMEERTILIQDVFYYSIR